MFGRAKQRAAGGGSALGRAVARLESLEGRRLLAADVGWSETVNGFRLSYELSDGSPALLLYGTPGDDVITVDGDPDDASLVHLTLNGVHYRVDARDFPGGEYSRLINFAACGGAGNDLVVRYSDASPFRDVILHGDDGNDTLIGGGGTDHFNGGAGDDLILAGGGDDYAFGTDGNDTLFGGAGRDELYGNEGDDVIWGEAGDDRTQGGQGDDQCHGGAGNDLVFGDEGADGMWGGEGDDDVAHTYNFDPVHDSADDRPYGGAGLDRFNFGSRETVDGSDAEPVEETADGDVLIASLRPPRPVVPPEPPPAAAPPVSEPVRESREEQVAPPAAPEPSAVTPVDKKAVRQQAKLAARAAKLERKRQARAAKLARRQAALEAKRLAAAQRRGQ